MDREVTPRLAEAVKARRQQLKLSHAAINGRGGPSSPILTKVESGAGTISDRTVERLEDALEWARGSIDRVLAGGEPVASTHTIRADVVGGYPTPPRLRGQGSGKTDALIGDVFVRSLIARLMSGRDVDQAELERSFAMSEEYQLRSLVDRIEQLDRGHQLEVSRLVDRLLQEEVAELWEQLAREGKVPGFPARPDLVVRNPDGSLLAFEIKNDDQRLDREGVRQQLLAYAARLREETPGNSAVDRANADAENGDPEGPEAGA